MEQISIPLVDVSFPGELTVSPNHEIFVGDVNVSRFFRDAMGRFPHIHGAIRITFVAHPLTNTVASSTMGGSYQEPPAADQNP